MKDAKTTAPRAATPAAARRGRPPVDRDTFGRLRISGAERTQAHAVGALYPEAENDSELAYRIWRRGLQLDLARLISLGGPLPSGLTEPALAALIAQDLLHCLPLLRRTGVLALLQLEPPAPGVLPPVDAADQGDAEEEEIDAAAAESIKGLGGADFI